MGKKKIEDMSNEELNDVLTPIMKKHGFYDKWEKLPEE